jgi:3-phosphoshikimate 1-carboxyvinyltransferase
VTAVAASDDRDPPATVGPGRFARSRRHSRPGGEEGAPEAVAPFEVRPATSLRGELHLPGDKSIAHRALLFNSLGDGEAEVAIRHPGADVRSTAGALATLGALESTTIGGTGIARYRVRGPLPERGGETIDCGNSGTSMRLLAGALAGRPGTVTLVGDGSLSARPMERVAAPLRAMGARVETTDGHAPLRISGGQLRAIDHRLPVASAQVLGAITIAALAADGRTRIESSGPTRDHTERLLAWLGAPVRRDGLITTIDGPARFDARSIMVPGDVSSAAAWLVAGALHPDAELRIRGVALNPSRLAIVAVLQDMGADITLRPGRVAGPEPAGDIMVRGGRQLRAVDLAGSRVAELIDELPLLGVAMAAADGTSELRDAAELRVKESDRIALVVQGLRAIGAEAEELPDGWRVRRGGAREASIETRGDHRIAMAFAIAATCGVARSVTLDDSGCVDVSYPGFWSDLARVTRSGR